MDKTAIFFQGQGSQFLGMGKSLYDRYNVVRDVFNEAEDILNFELTKICFGNSISELSKPQNMFPAIVTLGVAMYKLYLHLNGKAPDFMAGHSLGEYSALVCSNMLSFNDALLLVSKRAELSKDSNYTEDGTMTVIDEINSEEVAILCNKLSSNNFIVSPACYNSDKQTVVSGHYQAVMELEDEVIAKGGKVTPLISSPPFHSILMNKASGILRETLNNIDINQPVCKVISNYTGKVFPYNSNTIRSHLSKQMSNPVLWKQTISTLLENKIDTIIEMGTQPILINLIQPSLKLKNIDYKCYVFNQKDSLYIYNPERLDYISTCMAIACSTQNNNWNNSEYKQKVILPYKKLQKLYEDLFNNNQIPSDEQLKESKDLLISILTGKNIVSAEKKSLLKKLPIIS